MHLQKIQHELQKNHLDAALFILEETPIPSFTYITQIPSLTYASVLVKQTGKPILFVSSLDYAGIASTTLDIELLKKPLSEHLKAHLPKPKLLGIEFATTSFTLIKKIKKMFPKTKLKDTTELFEQVRAIKTPEEVNHLKKAASIANNAFNNIIKNFNFKTESGVKTALECEFLKYNVTASFPTIIASGKNAATPHHKTSTAKLSKGFCVIDFGVKYNGYCSDCTRTIYLGKPSKKEIQLYALVKLAQQTALDAVKAGIKAADLDKLARTTLGAQERYFIHSLGHGIGVEVHESPSLSRKSMETLRNGMVITIEPGIYNKNIGIRIEDMVFVDKKPRILTNITKELITIK